jgi:uncharacterized protein YcfJ
MHDPYYTLGCREALLKLGMQLTFSSPEQARQHYKTRGTIGDVAGFAGSLGGGLAGGALGAPGGPVGSIAGGLAGSAIGEKLLSFPATVGWDAVHDTRQRARSGYNKTLSRLNIAGGMPSPSSQGL